MCSFCVSTCRWPVPVVDTVRDAWQSASSSFTGQSRTARWLNVLIIHAVLIPLIRYQEGLPPGFAIVMLCCQALRTPCMSSRVTEFAASHGVSARIFHIRLNSIIWVSRYSLQPYECFSIWMDHLVSTDLVGNYASDRRHAWSVRRGAWIIWGDVKTRVFIVTVVTDTAFCAGAAVVKPTSFITWKTRSALSQLLMSKPVIINNTSFNRPACSLLYMCLELSVKSYSKL